MSLESTVAGLIQACNSLTDMVKQKMAGIDQKVDEATTAVTEKINESALSTFYLDPSAGNDANDGKSPATAKKTLPAVENSVAAGAVVMLILLSDLYLDPDITYAFNYNNNVRIVPLTGRVKIIFGITEDADGTHRVASFHRWRNVTLSFQGIDFDIDDSAMTTAFNPAVSRNPVIKTNASSAVSPSLFVRLRDCDLSTFIEKAYSLSSDGTGIKFMEITNNFAVASFSVTSISADSLKNQAVMFYGVDSSVASDKRLIVSSMDLVTPQV